MIYTSFRSKPSLLVMKAILQNRIGLQALGLDLTAFQLHFIQGVMFNTQ